MWNKLDESYFIPHDSRRALAEGINDYKRHGLISHNVFEWTNEYLTKDEQIHTSKVSNREQNIS